MRKVQFEEMFPWEFAQALAEAPIGYLPLGVLEWHGEHNAVGLDTLKAHAICIEAARKSGGIVLPPVYWAADSREDLPDGDYVTGGVESGERYHVPGSMYWVRPRTYYNLLLDIYEAMRRRGFRVIVVVAGHWSGPTVAIIRKTGKEFLASHPEMRWTVIIDYLLAGGLPYPHEHAAGGETSLLMAIRPDLVDLGKDLETDGALREFYAGQPAHLQRRRVTPNKYIGVLVAAEHGANDPETTASAERGQALLQAISDNLAAQARVLLADSYGGGATETR
jgi:creatinine amidohydrolase